MSKQDTILHIANTLNLTQAEAGRALNAVLSAMEEAFQQGKPVVLPGFGTLGVRERAARTGRNPKTGASLAIPASRAPYFKASSKLKALLNTSNTTKPK